MNRNLKLKQFSVRLQRGVVVPALVLLVLLVACLAIALVFRGGSGWWDEQQAEMQRQNSAADQAYSAMPAGAGELRELLDLVQKSNDSKVKEALGKALADDRLTNGEAMNIRGLIHSEMNEAERTAVLSQLKAAARQN